MASENRLLQEDLQPATSSSSDAYEVYWSSTEDDSSLPSTGHAFSSFEPSQFCRPGEAYNELWQIWDAQ
jgi:hypothetical protein